MDRLDSVDGVSWCFESDVWQFGLLVIDLVGAREGDIWPDTLQHILSDGTSREVQLSDDKDA